MIFISCYIRGKVVSGLASYRAENTRNTCLRCISLSIALICARLLSPRGSFVCLRRKLQESLR